MAARAYGAGEPEAGVGSGRAPAGHQPHLKSETLQAFLKCWEPDVLEHRIATLSRRIQGGSQKAAAQHS